MGRRVFSCATISGIENGTVPEIGIRKVLSLCAAHPQLLPQTGLRQLAAFARQADVLTDFVQIHMHPMQCNSSPFR